MYSFKKNRRVIGRSTRRLRLYSNEPKLGEIERLDERVDHANWIVLVDPVIEALRQKRRLPRSVPSTKRFIPSPRINCAG